MLLVWDQSLSVGHLAIFHLSVGTRTVAGIFLSQSIHLNMFYYLKGFKVAFGMVAVGFLSNFHWSVTTCSVIFIKHVDALLYKVFFKNLPNLESSLIHGKNSCTCYRHQMRR